MEFKAEVKNGEAFGKGKTLSPEFVILKNTNMKNNYKSEESVIYTKKYLDLSVRKLVAKLDLLKVFFNDLEASFLSGSISEIDLDYADVVAISRKRLHLVIDFTEKLSELKDSHNIEMCRAIDNVYRMLQSIKEQMSKLIDTRVMNVIAEIEAVIEFANGHVRNIVLTINHEKIEDALAMPFMVNSTNRNEIVDVLDNECEIIYDNSGGNAIPNLVEIEKEKNEITISEDEWNCKIIEVVCKDHNYAMKKEMNEPEFVNYDLGNEKSFDASADTSNILDENLGDYPQSDLSSPEEYSTDNSESSEPEILQSGANDEFPRPRIWNIRKVFRKYKARLTSIKRDIADML